MEAQQKMPILRSVRVYCLECMGGSRKLVDECDATSCGLYTYRRAYLDEKDATNVDLVDLCEGIANRCINCSSGFFKDCNIADCPLNKRIKTVIDVVYDRKKVTVNV